MYNAVQLPACFCGQSATVGPLSEACKNAITDNIARCFAKIGVLVCINDGTGAPI